MPFLVRWPTLLLFVSRGSEASSRQVKEDRHETRVQNDIGGGG
jgi:hypothetical protein